MARSSQRELNSWLDAHGYHHAGAKKKIHQAPIGRPVFAAHERDHHITTSGRRALGRGQFALPPGPEEKRRGIAGRLPIDTIARARNALQRAVQMKQRGHISAGELDAVRAKVHRAWPSIHSTAHSPKQTPLERDFAAARRLLDQQTRDRRAQDPVVRERAQRDKAEADRLDREISRLLTRKPRAGTSHATRRGMSKAEVLSEFNELYPPGSFKRHGGTIDKPMRAEAWNNYTDALAKDGRITMKQYETWVHPWRD